MQKLITRIVTFLLIGTLLIQPECLRQISKSPSNTVSTFSHGDEEPSEEKD